MNDKLLIIPISAILISIIIILAMYSMKSEHPAGIIEAPCEEIHYSQRARDNRLIVCRYKDLILFNDNGFQGDSLRQIKINELLETL